MSILTFDFKSDNNTYTGEVDSDNYFKSVSDIKEFIMNKKILFWEEFEDNRYFDIKNSGSIQHLINEIEEKIINNGKVTSSYPRFIAEELQPLFSGGRRMSIKRLIDDLPKYEDKKINKYKSQYEQLIQVEKETKSKSWECLKNNWSEIKEFLLSLAVDKAEQAKQRLKISQAKYYQKKKALLGIENKPKLTAEEKAERYKEQLKKANKTYYEKKRLELIELGVMKPKQTEEEKRNAKKEANKRYYDSKKLKVAELENKVEATIKD